MLKPTDNPPMHWPEGAGLENAIGRWWVAHCKPRQEKALAWDILRSGASYFLPMYDKTLASRGRRWTSRVVLFAGYLFFCGGEAERMTVVRSDRIVRLIDVADQSRFVRELAGIERMLAAKLPIGAVSRLVRGTVCRVTAGPLAGLEGVVERRKGRTRLVIMVDMLGQGAAVEMDADLLEAV